MASLHRSISDDLVTIRPFEPSDRDALIQGRDKEFHRFLGIGSSEPSPTGSIWVGQEIVGWIDYDDLRPWLAEPEVNVGYNVFPEHRGNGYGSHAVRLLCRYLASLDPPLQPTLLIDPTNMASLKLAARTGFEHVGDVDGERLFRTIGAHSEPANCHGSDYSITGLR